MANGEHTDPLTLEYWRAVLGEAEEPNEALLRDTEDVPNRDEVVEDAVESLLTVRNVGYYDRPKGFRTPDEIVEEALGLGPEHNGSVLWHKMLTIVNITAKQDPFYWGVKDPERESYCSYCRQVRPMEEFEERMYMCNACIQERRSA